MGIVEPWRLYECEDNVDIQVLIQDIARRFCPPSKRGKPEVRSNYLKNQLIRDSILRILYFQRMTIHL